jgi:hypothetical protein
MSYSWFSQWYLFTNFIFFCFVTSERILSTLAKVNQLLILIESCSAGEKSTWILIFTKVQLILDELFTIFTTVHIHEFYFFLFCHFRAYFKHFNQSKSTSFINWKLFSSLESTWIFILMKVQLIFVELLIFYNRITSKFIFLNVFCLKFNYLKLVFYLILLNKILFKIKFNITI